MMNHGPGARVIHLSFTARLSERRWWRFSSRRAREAVPSANASALAGVLLALSLFWGCAAAKGDAQPVGRTAAIALAKDELFKHGYPVEEMLVEADETNRKWVSYLRSTPDAVKQFEPVLAKLDGKRYWAVYLAPAPIPNIIIMDGDAFVFVETPGGAILSVLLFP
jgi:hypothetical protein